MSSSREATVVYGIHPVVEILEAQPETVERVWIADALRGPAIQRVLDRAQRAKVRTERLPKDRIDRLAPGAVHQGVIAQVAQMGYRDLDDLFPVPGDAPPLLLALDQVQDPIHVGASLRSAHLLGGHGLILPKDRAAGLTPAAVKASAGAAAHLPVARITNLARTLDQLKERGLWVVGADMEGDPCDEVDLSGPLCLVVGGEGKGLRHLTKARCDRLVSIPMLAGGVGSYSASVAASILLYEIARQRRGGRPSEPRDEKKKISLDSLP